MKEASFFSSFFGSSLVLVCLVTSKLKFFAEASFGAACWYGESLISVLANDDVGVVNVDSNPLWVGAISTDSDVLIPSVDGKVIVDEPVLLLGDSEAVEVGLPVFALFGGTHVFSVLGWLDGEEYTAGAVVLLKSLVAAGGSGKAVNEATTSCSINIVVSVNFVLWSFVCVVFVTISSNVLVIVLVVESDAGADTRDVALHVL